MYGEVGLDGEDEGERFMQMVNGGDDNLVTVVDVNGKSHFNIPKEQAAPIMIERYRQEAEEKLARGEKLTGAHKRVMTPEETDPYKIAYNQCVEQMSGTSSTLQQDILSFNIG